MKEWYLKLSRREQKMVLSSVAVIIVFMFYMFIVKPVSEHYIKNKNDVVNGIETLEWMKNAAQEVNQLRGGRVGSNRPQSKQLVLSLVDRSARKAGLGNSMKRVQPENDDGVRVWFENASFDELITWLATIESENGLSVNEINVEQTEITGLVNVRVFLN